MIKFLFLKKLWLFVFHLLQLLAMGLDFIFFQGYWSKRKKENVVKQYQATLNQACVTKQLDTEKLPFADTISIIEPHTRVDGKQAVISKLKQFLMNVHRFEIKKQFFNETDACTVVECIMSMPKGSVPMVEWLEIKNGKIQTIHWYYDTANL
ncbi:MAG: nuclear transport factor 2 family protein [Candidatus Babeliales bacterium]